MQGPLIAAQMTQAVGGEIDGLADPHAGQSRQQERSREQIVASEEFGLQAGVIFRR
jgi:hypothetical protein